MKWRGDHSYYAFGIIGKLLFISTILRIIIDNLFAIEICFSNCLKSSLKFVHEMRSLG